MTTTSTYVNPTSQGEGVINVVQYGIEMPNGKIIWVEPGQNAMQTTLFGATETVWLDDANVRNFDVWVNKWKQRANSAGADTEVIPARVKRQLIVIALAAEPA